MIYQFGPKLKMLRKLRHLSQNEVASKLGVNPSTISLYESGTCKPQSDILLKFCQFYGTTTDFLLGLDNDPVVIVEGLSIAEQRFICQFNCNLRNILLNIDK